MILYAYSFLFQRPGEPKLASMIGYATCKITDPQTLKLALIADHSTSELVADGFAIIDFRLIEIPRSVILDAAQEAEDAADA